jgi:hypothetical protein
MTKSLIDYLPEDINIYIGEILLRNKDKEAYKIAIMGEEAAQSFTNLMDDLERDDQDYSNEEQWEQDFQLEQHSEEKSEDYN